MKSDEPQNRHTASFRDPSGFVFSKDGIICRRINRSYKDNYDFLIGSGLYDRLAGDGLLVAHKEVENVDAESGEAYKIIEPDPIPFISYPYEWCFSQLKHAALLTLKIQRLSMDAGMTLKDCSAYNVQFRRGKPVLIDTLSFERYRDGKPWVGYSQFCRHFLAPLALMSKKDVRLGNLLRIFIDGIPLDFAGGLLPWSTFLSFSILSHVHMQARARKRAP
ncbi:MAG: SAM-dependent methyltransferase, partial [Deltaproteobacteria bacterium]|nr:SAM-dependent methyltransferase [Deltaproteobacteria bacterium]